MRPSHAQTITWVDCEDTIDGDTIDGDTIDGDRLVLELPVANCPLPIPKHTR